METRPSDHYNHMESRLNSKPKIILNQILNSSDDEDSTRAKAGICNTREPAISVQSLAESSRFEPGISESSEPF